MELFGRFGMAKPNISIVIATSQRLPLLQWQLRSLQKQVLLDVEILVCDDATADNDTECFVKACGYRYYRTGIGKKRIWRPPICAFNVGIRNAQGSVLVLAAAEMYHVNDTISFLCNVVKGDAKALAIPFGYDDDGRVLSCLNAGQEPLMLWERLPVLNTKLPFLLAVRKEHIINIGGYDERFLEGEGYDDDDLIWRLKRIGCRFAQTEARCVHLYHPRCGSGRSLALIEHNRVLFEQKKREYNENMYRIDVL